MNRRFRVILGQLGGLFNTGFRRGISGASGLGLRVPGCPKPSTLNPPDLGFRVYGIPSRK